MCSLWYHHPPFQTAHACKLYAALTAHRELFRGRKDNSGRSLFFLVLSIGLRQCNYRPCARCRMRCGRPGVVGQAKLLKQTKSLHRRRVPSKGVRQFDTRRRLRFTAFRSYSTLSNRPPLMTAHWTRKMRCSLCTWLHVRHPTKAAAYEQNFGLLQEIHACRGIETDRS